MVRESYLQGMIQRDRVVDHSSVILNLKIYTIILIQNAHAYGAPEVCTQTFPLSWDQLHALNESSQQRSYEISLDMISSDNPEGKNRIRVIISLYDEILERNGDIELQRAFPGIGEVCVWLHDAYNVDGDRMVITRGDIISHFHGADDDDECELFRQKSLTCKDAEGSHSFAGTVPVMGALTNLKVQVSIPRKTSLMESIVPVGELLSAEEKPSIQELSLNSVTRGHISASGKVHISAMYVPYIRGEMMVSLSNIRLESNDFDGHEVGIRVYLPGVTNSYSNVTKVSGSNGSLSELGIIKFSIDSLIAFQAADDVQPLTLQIYLLDVTESLTIGKAEVSCHGLFNNALKKAISTSSNERSIDRDVDVKDLRFGMKVGTIVVSQKLKMNGVSPVVDTTLQSMKKSRSSGELFAAKTELQLKKLFQKVDTDNSGEISLDEFLTVMNEMKAHIDEGYGTNAEIMESLATLLAVRECDEASMRRIFHEIDLDGGDTLSWWEWKESLGARLGSTVEGTHNFYNINMADPLLIAMSAATAAISHNDNIRTYVIDEGVNITSSLSPAGAGSPKRGQKVKKGCMRMDSDSLSLITKLPAPKAVSRLKKMCEDLKSSNSVLSQRLENALIQSQKYSDTTDTISSLGPPRVKENSPSKKLISVLEDDRLQVNRKLNLMQEENTDIQNQLIEEKKKSEMLQMELNRAKLSLRLADKQRHEMLEQKKLAELSAQQDASRMKGEIIGFRATRFRKIILQKRVMRFLLDSIPKLKHLVKNRKIALLTQLLAKIVRSRNNRRRINKEKLSSICIQAAIRSKLSRLRFHRLVMNAIRIQKNYRAYHGRNVYIGMKVLYAMEYAEEAKLKRQKEEKACILIQSIIRGHNGRNIFDAKREEQLIFAANVAQEKAETEARRRALQAKAILEAEALVTSKSFIEAIVSELIKSMIAEYTPIREESIMTSMVPYSFETIRTEINSLVGGIVSNTIARVEEIMNQAVLLPQFVDLSSPSVVEKSFTAVSKPSLDAAVGYYISLHMPPDEDEDDDDYHVLEGEVMHVDQQRKILLVSSPDHDEEEVPYNLPGITWLKTINAQHERVEVQGCRIEEQFIQAKDAEQFIQAKDASIKTFDMHRVKRDMNVEMGLEANSKQNNKEGRSDIREAKTMGLCRPPLMESIGWKIAIHDSEGEGDVLAYGLVVDFNIENELLRCRISHDDNNDNEKIEYEEEIPYEDTHVRFIEAPVEIGPEGTNEKVLEENPLETARSDMSLDVSDDESFL